MTRFALLLSIPWVGFAQAMSLPNSVVSSCIATPLESLAKAMPRSMLSAPKGELKYVVLGLGTQNYTCSGRDGSAAPGTTGATATLYDIGNQLNRDPPAAKWKIPGISGLALSLSAYPKALQGYLRLAGYDQIVGHHYFGELNGTNTPIFAFDSVPHSPQPVARVSKVEGVDAPKSAYPGLQNEGAVPWLHLADMSGYSVGGVDTVYRLETAGGKAPLSCEGQSSSFVVPYAAQYWVFGPKCTSNGE